MKPFSSLAANCQPLPQSLLSPAILGNRCPAWRNQAQGRYFGGSGSAGRQKESLDNSLFFRLVSLLANSDFAREAVMTIGQSMLPEFDQEMQSTRKTLERVPNDDQHRRARLRARRWPELRAAENQQPEGTARRLRQRIWRGTRGACQGERCGNAEELEAARWRQGDSQHASRGLYPRHGVEPPDSSPRATHGLLSPDRCSRAGPLWSQRGGSSTVRGGSRCKLS